MHWDLRETFGADIDFTTTIPPIVVNDGSRFNDGVSIFHANITLNERIGGHNLRVMGTKPIRSAIVGSIENGKMARVRNKTLKYIETRDGSSHWPAFPSWEGLKMNMEATLAAIS